MHELLQCQITSVYLFNLLLIVEAGQFLWFAVHPSFTFLWNTSFAQYPRDIIQYFQVDQFFRQGDSSFFYAFLYLSCVVQLVALLSLIVILWKFEESKRKSSTVVYYTLRLVSYYTLLMITIAPIPLFNTFIEAIICQDDDALKSEADCYEGYNLVNTILAAISLAVFLPLCLIAQFLHIDENPASDIPFAGPQSNLAMFKLAIKIALPIYTTLDGDFDYQKTFIILYTIVWILVLAWRYYSQGYFNSTVSVYATCGEAIVFWGSLGTCLQAFIEKDNSDDLGVYFFLCVAPFAAYAYYALFMRQRWGFMRINIRSLKSVRQIERHIYVVSEMIEEIHHPQNRIELEGLLRYHRKSCRKSTENCMCHTLSLNVARVEDIQEEKKIWYRFLKSLLEDSVSKFPKSPKLHLQYAYFQQDRIQNRFKALYELMITEENRPDLREEFSIFHYKNKIEKEMKESDIRNSDSRGIDVNTIVRFQEGFVNLQTEISKSVRMQLEFWRELEQTSPNVQQLLLLGSKITIQAELVKQAYSSLSEINSNHHRMLSIYGNFLKDIMNDTFEAQRIIEKAEYVKNSLQDRGYFDNERFKYSENSRTCIITCSANIHSIGNVLDANSEIERVLGYPHTEIIGRNISQIMPDCIGSIHDDLMKRYFQTSSPHIMGRERQIYAMNKSGYTVPCGLMIKVYPNLDEGIRVVGFLRKLEADFASKTKLGEEIKISQKNIHFILCAGEDHIIQGVSESCYEAFGIPSGITNGLNPEFTLDTIIPEIHEHNLENLKTQMGETCTMDTTNLPQNFLIGYTTLKSEADFDIDDEKLKNKKYRSAQVRVSLIEDDFFLERMKMRVFKIVDLGEDNTTKNNGYSENIQTESHVHRESQFHETEVDEEDDAVEKGMSDIDELRSEGIQSSIADGEIDEAGEESRKLKDIKVKIAEKSTPYSIIFLRMISLILCILLITITSIQLDYKGTQIKQMKTGLNATHDSYKRHDLMADINYYTRILYMLANGLVNTGLSFDFYVEAIRTNVDFSTEIVLNLLKVRDKLKEFNPAEFDISQARMVQNQTMDGKITLGKIPIQSKQPDGTIMNSMVYVNQAYYIYMGFATRMGEIPMVDYISSSASDISIAEQGFYFIRVNGLGGLRTISENVSDLYANFYLDRITSFQGFSLGTMFVAISFVIITTLIFMPKVFSVNKTNMKVLSLFGYIPPEEVRLLADKCELYMDTYLDKIVYQKDYSSYFSGYDQDEELHKLTHNNHGDGDEDEDDTEPQHAKQKLSSIEESRNESDNPADYTMQMKEFSESEHVQKLRMLPVSPRSQMSAPETGNLIEVTTHRATERPFLSGRNQTDRGSPSPDRLKKSTKLSKDLKEEDEEYQEYLHERGKKLRNSKDHSKKRVVIRLCSVGFILIAYYIIDFAMHMDTLSTYKKIVAHLQMICQRSPDLKYVTDFVGEELNEDDFSVVYPSLPSATVATNNYRTQYISKVYSNQKKITDSMNEKFPGHFDKYFAKLEIYSYDDMCASYYTNDPAGEAYCISLASGKLKLGLIQTETWLLSFLQSYLAKFYATSGRTLQTRKDFLNAFDYQNAGWVNYLIKPMLTDLVDTYMNAGTEYLSDQYTRSKIKFGAFLLVLGLLMLFVLWPYLEKLKQQIFRTKALLNMIPMAMLQKNKMLKESFLSKEILDALQ